jgi:hypothetical protein
MQNYTQAQTPDDKKFWENKQRDWIMTNASNDVLSQKDARDKIIGLEDHLDFNAAMETAIKSPNIYYDKVLRGEYSRMTDDHRRVVDDFATRRKDTLIREDYFNAGKYQSALDDRGYNMAMRGEITPEYLTEHWDSFSPAGRSRIQGVMAKNPLAQAPGINNEAMGDWVKEGMNPAATSRAISRTQDFLKRYPSDTTGLSDLKELQNHLRSFTTQGHMENAQAATKALDVVTNMNYQGKKLWEWYQGGIHIQVGGPSRTEVWNKEARHMVDQIRLGEKRPDQAMQEFVDTITGQKKNLTPNAPPESQKAKMDDVLKQMGQ